MSVDKGLLYKLSLPFEAIAWAVCNAVGRRGSAVGLLSVMILGLSPIVWIVMGAKYSFWWYFSTAAAVVVLMWIAKAKVARNPLGGLGVSFIWKLVLALPFIVILWFLAAQWASGRFDSATDGKPGKAEILTSVVFLWFWGGSALASLIRHARNTPPPNARN